MKKCSKCKKEFEEDQLEKVGKKHFCFDCYEEYYVPMVLDWNDLYDYIRDYWCVEQLSIGAITLLKKYQSEKQMSYYGMLNTYDYMVMSDVDLSQTETYGIGLIPYYYDEARNFFGKVRNNIDKETRETKTLKITTKRYEEPKNNKMIDMRKIWEDEEDGENS